MSGKKKEISFLLTPSQAQEIAEIAKTRGETVEQYIQRLMSNHVVLQDELEKILTDESAQGTYH